MFKYWTKIEKNLYTPELLGKPLGRGYDGWLSTQMPPLNLVTDLDKIDLQLTSVLASIQTAVLPVTLADWNNPINDNVDGAGAVILTKNSNLTRSSVRDHLVATKELYPQRLKFLTETLATNVLMCRNSQGKAQAYGVETVAGAYLLPIQSKFAGPNGNLVKTQITAKYEVILSAGTFQTPQLLMLSGIGDPAQLGHFGIPSVVSLPGVGINLQDRLEMTTVWKLKQDHVIYKGCTFGSDPATDPCLKTWQEQGRNNLYSAGPAIWAHSYKSDPSLKALDVWSMWGPGTFRGYKRGWAQALADTHNAFINVILKGHTSSKGWVRLTGPGPQDKLEINKNQFVDAAGLKDLDITVAAVKKSREFPSKNLGMGLWVTEEVWPGPSVETDDQLRDFIRKNAWGHHACCTAKMGPDTDVNAVLDNNFKVKGVDNLRVVDNSVWPDIPGLFVTTPIYMISEKAADAVASYASTKGWTPSG
ncbi:hypothetical protein FRC03_006600 [Tulasnella sp. 419]|nr:hypothetical protein FRC03_006600 [Tulasnella sp. 419]